MDAFAASGSRLAGNANGTRSYVAVLFSDLCGSTSLSANLDADQYVEMLESIRAEGMRIMALFGGRVAQIYGDGMLSIFQGATASAQAVDAALMLHRAVALIAPPSGAKVKALQLHSGIHAGLVLLRDGDATRGTIEAVGRTTAVAARLSAAALPDEVLVSSGSLGPGRAAFETAEPRRIDIGDGSRPVLALPVLPGRVDEVAESPGGTGQASFVGRRAELSQFAGWLDGLARGEAFHVAIAGPPGQGKSRLSREVASLAESRGIAVFRGACSAAPTVGPLHPFRQMLHAPDDSDPDSDALVEGISTLLCGRPALLILDDWQWSDAASAIVLGRLRQLRPAPATLLLTRDTGHLSVSHANDTILRLPPLSPDETGALVRGRRPELDPIDAARVHARAGGNPLYAEELCLLDAHRARAMLPDGTEPTGSGWLASLVAWRQRQLPEPAQRVLETAATIGMAPPRWLLDALLGEEAVDAALDGLIAQDFLVREPADDNLTFKHGITWEIIYSLIPLAARRRLHSAIANTIEGRDVTPGVDRHEALAWHYLASKQPGKSWEHAELAGDRAMAAASLEGARLHYRMALETLAANPELHCHYPRYAALVGKFGFACIYDSEKSDGPLLAEAADLAEAQGDRNGQANAHYWLGYVLHGSGDARASIHHCQQALALADLPAHAPFMVQVRATLGQSLAIAANYQGAIPLLDDAIAIKRLHRSGRRASVGMAYTLAQRAAIWADTGHFPQAHAMLEEALGLLCGETHPVEASIMAWHAVVCAWQGDWDRLADIAMRGADTAQRIEAIYIHAICRAFGCFGRWKRDGDDNSAEGLATAVACLVDRQKTMTLSIAGGFLAEVHLGRGDADGVQAMAGLAFARGRAGDLLGLAWASRVWAEWLSHSDPDRARVYLARARANAGQRQSAPELARCDLAEVRLGLASAADRSALLDRAITEFHRMGMPNLVAEAAALARSG